MAFYTNNTRHAAIITLLIQSTADQKSSLLLGAKSQKTLAAGIGHHDFEVGPGESITLNNDTLATMVSIRSAP